MYELLYHNRLLICQQFGATGVAHVLRFTFYWSCFLALVISLLTNQNVGVEMFIAQLVEHRTGTSLTQVRFPDAAGDFSPRVNSQCTLSYCARITPCAIASIYICAHVKNPVVHVRVRWIMETLKHPACTVNWVARFCCSWLSPGKTTQISHGRNPIGTIQL